MADGGVSNGAAPPMLQVDGVSRHYALRRGLLASLVGDRRAVHALNGVSFTLESGAPDEETRRAAKGAYEDLVRRKKEEAARLSQRRRARP